MGALLLLGFIAPAVPSQAQGRPKQYQIPTTFDSVYTKRPAYMVFFIAWEHCGGGQIEWVTLREGKIAAFAVQSSLDGHSWQEIERMAANPGASEQRIYTLYDSNIRRYNAPVIYYRVQEIAKTGHCVYSPVRSIHIGNPDMPWRTLATPSRAQASQ